MPLQLQPPLSGGVRHRMEVPADGDHSVAADEPLDGKDRVVGMCGQGDQGGTLLGKNVEPAIVFDPTFDTGAERWRPLSTCGTPTF